MPMGENTNLELISLIWLDNMANAIQEDREIQDKLRSVVNYLKICDSCQQCEDYLKQVIPIFIFCMDKARNELWANKYKKVCIINDTNYPKITPDRIHINGFQLNSMFQQMVKLNSNHISIIYIQFNINNYIN